MGRTRRGLAGRVSSSLGTAKRARNEKRKLGGCVGQRRGARPSFTASTAIRRGPSSPTAVVAAVRLLR